MIKKIINLQTPPEKFYLEHVIRHIPQFIFWKDTNSVYLGCNDNYAKLIGLNSRHDIVGKTDLDFYWQTNGDSAEFFRQGDRETMAGKAIINQEEWLSLTNGKKILVLVNKSAIRDDESNIIGVLGIATDITARKRNENELRLAKEEAEIANQLKTEFIQNMQHDIRTPVAGIWSMLEYLARTETNLERKENLELTCNSAKELLDICNEVIDFEKLEHGKRPYLNKKLEIRKLVKEVIRLEAIAAKQKGIEFVCTISDLVPNVVKGDEYRLRRILINLISNAIKFTKTGSVSLLIDCGKLQERKCIIIFTIEDTGIGIPEEKMELIYEKFSRINPSNHGQYKGAGLGLNIVKKFVEDMEGEVDVENKKEGGTIFYVTIPFDLPLLEKILQKNKSQNINQIIERNLTNPINKLELHSSPVTTDKKNGKAIAQVLFIEDDKLAQLLGIQKLTELACNVVLAESVSEAKHLLKNTKFDMVLSDIGLPDGTGTEIIKMVRKSSNHLNYTTPFIALTAHADRKKQEDIQKAGFASIQIKPVLPEQLKNLLDIYVLKSPIAKAETEQDVLDLELGKTLTGDNEKLAKQLLEGLVKQLPETLVLIQKLYQQQDIKGLANVIHKLLGSIAYCGVTNLQATVRKLNSSLKEAKSMPQIEHDLQLLSKDIQAVIDTYDALR